MSAADPAVHRGARGAARVDPRASSRSELRPHATEWEEARWFPDEVFAQAAPRSGFLGLKYPEEYGGQGGDYLHEAVLAEELARCGSGGLAAGIGAHVDIATPPIWKFGTDDQKERYLAPRDRRREDRRARRSPSPTPAPTSPGIKHDAPSASTAAGVVNGSKMFITNGVRADFSSPRVKTTGEGGHHGISFLIVDTPATASAPRQDREARLARLRHRR